MTKPELPFVKWVIHPLVYILNYPYQLSQPVPVSAYHYQLSQPVPLPSLSLPISPTVHSECIKSEKRTKLA